MEWLSTIGTRTPCSRTSPLVEQRFENAEERPLVAGRQPGQRTGAPSHLSQQLRPHPRACRRQQNPLHPPVLDGGLPSNESACLEPIDQTGDVRRITSESLGEPAHRQRTLGLNEMEDVALHRRELEGLASRG